MVVPSYPPLQQEAPRRQGRRQRQRRSMLLILIAIVVVLVFNSFTTVEGNTDESRSWIGCPKVTDGRYDVRLNSDDPVRPFTEISGLVISQTQQVATADDSSTSIIPISEEAEAEEGSGGDPILYAATDGNNSNGEEGGGGGGRIGVFNGKTGQRIVSLVLPASTGQSWDWETMTIGSCGHTPTEANCIYIGDVGDNIAIHSNGRRTDRGDTWPYRIIKFREPDLRTAIIDAENDNDDIQIPPTDIWILPFDYSHSSSPKPFADCEAIFLDHTGWGQNDFDSDDVNSIGDLYLVTKWNRKYLHLNRIFKIPVNAWQQTPINNPWEQHHLDIIMTPEEVEVEKKNTKPQHQLRQTGNKQQQQQRQSTTTTTSFSINIPQTDNRVNASSSSSSISTPPPTATAPSDAYPSDDNTETNTDTFESVGGVTIDLNNNMNNNNNANNNPPPASNTPAPTTASTTNVGVTYLPMYSPKVVGAEDLYSTHNDDDNNNNNDDDDSSSPSLLPSFLQYQWTGAEMPLDGQVISLSTKTVTLFYLRCPGESVLQALLGAEAEPCLEMSTINPTNLNGMETTSWTSNGKGYLQIPEGIKPRMGWATIDRDDIVISTAKECPADNTMMMKRSSTNDHQYHHHNHNEHHHHFENWDWNW